MLKPSVKLETKNGQRLHASLQEHQAQMHASGEIERQVADRRRRFWRSDFLMFVLPPAVVCALIAGWLTYSGAGTEQIAPVSGVGVFAALVGFVIFYPRA